MKCFSDSDKRECAVHHRHEKGSALISRWKVDVRPGVPGVAGEVVLRSCRPVRNAPICIDHQEPAQILNVLNVLRTTSALTTYTYFLTHLM